MKVGDHVKIANQNPNHLGKGTCAYAGAEGVVLDIAEDGSFCIDTGHSTITFPMNNAFQEPKKGYFVIIDEKIVFHKHIEVKKITRNPKKWYQWFIPKSLMK